MRFFAQRGMPSPFHNPKILLFQLILEHFGSNSFQRGFFYNFKNIAFSAVLGRFNAVWPLLFIYNHKILSFQLIFGIFNVTRALSFYDPKNIAFSADFGAI